MKTNLVLLVGATLTASVCGQVLPNDAVVAGKTIGEWTAECWHWIDSISTNENPILDCNGRWANNRQPNPMVFFIAPLNGITPPPCIRAFTVPEDRFILLPVLGIAIDNIDTVPPLTIEQMHDTLNGVLDVPAELHASIDGVAVPNLLDHRATSPVFSLDLTSPDNPSSFFYQQSIVGLVDPIIADGYWLMLEPLAPGPHVLHTGGQTTIPIFLPHDIICNITAVPVPVPQWVEDFLAVLKAADFGGKNPWPLLASLERARDLLAAKRLQAGINQLRAFQNKIRAQVAPIAAPRAEDWIGYAQRIIERAERELK